MTVRKRRDRLIALRVTVEELKFLEKACESRGGRSMSEFARTELLCALSKPEACSSGDLAGLEARIKELEARLLEPGSDRPRAGESEVELVPSEERR